MGDAFFKAGNKMIVAESFGWNAKVNVPQNWKVLVHNFADGPPPLRVDIEDKASEYHLTPPPREGNTSKWISAADLMANGGQEIWDEWLKRHYGHSSAEWSHDAWKKNKVLYCHKGATCKKCTAV